MSFELEKRVSSKKSEFRVRKSEFRVRKALYLYLRPDWSILVIFAFIKCLAFLHVLPNSDPIEDKTFLYQLFYCVHRLVANENSQYVKRFTFICVKTGTYNYSKMWRLSTSP